MENMTLVTYLAFLLISVGFTVWVGRTLYRNGHHFLVETFDGREDLAKSVNHLLVVGFYLVNLGWVSVNLRIYPDPKTLTIVVELLSEKIGMVLLSLGFMHFFNLFIFSKIRSRSRAAIQSFPPQRQLDNMGEPRSR